MTLTVFQRVDPLQAFRYCSNIEQNSTDKWHSCIETFR